jgi:hypothetical protein
MARGITRIGRMNADQIRAHPLHPRSSASNSSLRCHSGTSVPVVVNPCRVPAATISTIQMTHENAKRIDFCLPFGTACSPTAERRADQSPQNIRIMRLLVGTPTTPAKLQMPSVSRDPEVRRRGARCAASHRCDRDLLPAHYAPSTNMAAFHQRLRNHGVPRAKSCCRGVRRPPRRSLSTGCRWTKFGYSVRERSRVAGPVAFPPSATRRTAARAGRVRLPTSAPFLRPALRSRAPSKSPAFPGELETCSQRNVAARVAGS